MLYAWSTNPGTPGTPGFGVYDSPGVLENTGLNRVLGGQDDTDDSLFGGTGLDLLYGNGGDDKYYTKDGRDFAAEGDADGNVDWKVYAKSQSRVWYVGATDQADEIDVDFFVATGELAAYHSVRMSGPAFSVPILLRFQSVSVFKGSSGNDVYWQETDTDGSAGRDLGFPGDG
ncbi:MAG: hypothetical protein U1D30_13895 [Planctomycetota bacterium]